MCFTSTKLWLSKQWTVILFLISITLLTPAGRPEAQVLQPHRYEIPLHHSEPTFEVTPAKQNGLVLNRYLANLDNNLLHLIRLDTTFTELWSGVLPVEKDLALSGKKSDDVNLYFLFKHLVSNNFELLRINQTTSNYTWFTIKSFIRFHVTEFQVVNESILIGGYFNRVPLVLYFNSSTGQSRVLPGLFNEEGELTQIRTYPDGTFQVLISAPGFTQERSLWIKNYSPDGNLIDNYALTSEDRKTLIFGRSIKTNNNMQVVAGVYGTRNREYSRGIFIATIDPNGFQQLKYYNYGDLQNFFNYMKVRRENRIKERIERRKIKGKKIKFNYRFLVHEVIEHNGQYIMLGEAFYPQYKSVSSSGYAGFFRPYNNFGNSYMRGDQIFDGYHYTHAVVIGFDKNGKLLWDNSFEINDVKTFTLEQFVRLEVQGDRIALLYLFDNQIRTKIIQNNTVIEGKSVDPLRTFHEQDIVLNNNTSINRMNYWYDTNFYAFGTQYLVNANSGDEATSRKVFFINKIRYNKLP